MNGEVVTAAPTKRLLLAQYSDIRIAYKLTPAHFPDKGLERHKVSLATQIFSNSVSAATAIERLRDLSILNPATYHAMPPETTATAKFLKLLNNWFDRMNTHKPIIDTRPTKRAYGLPGSLSDPMNASMETNAAILNSRVIVSKSPAKAANLFQRLLFSEH